MGTRARGNNIHFIGIPEGPEDFNASEFITGLLQDILNLDQKPLLDRVHHILHSRPDKNKPLRPFMCFIIPTVTRRCARLRNPFP